MAGLSATEFVKRVEKGKPVPGVLLLGSDRYLRDLCRAKLIEAYVPEAARVWGVTRFSLEDDSMDSVLAQAQTMPMLAERQVLFAEDAESLERLGDAARDAVLERLGRYFDDPAPFTLLVFEAALLDRRTKVFKALSEATLVVSVELSESLEDRLAVGGLMARDIARQQGVELGEDAAEELVESCDGDLARVQTELAKLATYVGERQKVTRSDVEALVVSAKRYSVWQLADMLASRNGPQAVAFLDSLLREGEQPAALVGAMAWMCRKLIEAQEIPGNTSKYQAAGHLGVRPDTAEMAMRQSRKIPRPQLLDGLTALSEADSRLKSGPADARAVMEFLVAKLTGTVAVPKDLGSSP